ncbi:phosphoribosylaminoimidazole synthetase [Verrucomicrobia bacterium SCGC AG-212-E04]|nr:phosphoribosylaminoimidazole synthetase [Verrucomicrobia bacterium SCGC AG-212-E04]
MPAPKTKAYARAGVDVDLGNRLKGGLHARLAATHTANVLGKVGGFGGLYRANFPGMRDPVLVSSVDGVGTKLKIAFATDRHNTVGADLVNHCVNDIAVVGARPLFFLDYIGAGKLDPRVFHQLIAGFTKACAAAGCALIGGETAQMPGMYAPGEYDLAGTVVGVVERARMLDGSRIRPGDVVLGLASDGLHTNGYSLARAVLIKQGKLSLAARLPGVKLPLGRELLRVHRNYQPLMASLPRNVLKGAAHITGGGLIDNLPRILPTGCDAVIDTKSWTVPALFRHIESMGSVPRDEMYQVFNMGIGMALVVSSKDAVSVARLTKARRIGRIEKGTGRTRLI